MDSSSLALSPISVLRSPMISNNNSDDGSASTVFDSCTFQANPKIPRQFIWPSTDRSPGILPELDAPVVDLSGLFLTDEASTNPSLLSAAIQKIRSACLSHGFFQITNHGLDPSLTRSAMAYADAFFSLPRSRKLLARRVGMAGYAGAHADRFASRLPWKETLSLAYTDSAAPGAVEDYLSLTLGLKEMGRVYESYCAAVRALSGRVVDLLSLSLGVEAGRFNGMFEGGTSIMRCNYYPACPEPELTLGTGPHCDPTAITMLQQDGDVDGLEVYTDGMWHSVRPSPGALVINVGDTFKALSNGMYKSCLHRAVVNRRRARKSLAFFLCPRDDAVVRPPTELAEGAREYPDFMWPQLLQFTQKHYRADMDTLQRFTEWILESTPSPAAGAVPTTTGNHE